MDTDQAIQLSSQMLLMAAQISAPILGTALLVGLLISILQVVTQIQEMTLTFVPKVLAVVFVILLFGNWMLTALVTYASELIRNIPSYL